VSGSCPPSAWPSGNVSEATFCAESEGKDERALHSGAILVSRLALCTETIRVDEDGTQKQIRELARKLSHKRGCDVGCDKGGTATCRLVNHALSRVSVLALVGVVVDDGDYAEGRG